MGSTLLPASVQAFRHCEPRVSGAWQSPNFEIATVAFGDLAMTVRLNGWLISP
jgi:hypothetical protein